MYAQPSVAYIGVRPLLAHVQGLARWRRLGRQECQVEAAYQAGPQCFVRGEAAGDGLGGLGGGRGRVQYEGEGAVGPAGAEVGAEHQGLGGNRRAYRGDHGRVGQRVRRGAPFGEREQGRAGELVRDGARKVEYDGVGLLVGGGLESLVQGTATGRASGSQRASDSVDVKAGRAVRSPALRVGTAMSLVFSRRSPFSSSSTSPSTATTGTRSRAPLSAARTGPCADRSSAQAVSAALSRGSAEPSSSEKPGSGMFLFATGTEPIGGRWRSVPVGRSCGLRRSETRRSRGSRVSQGSLTRF